MRKGRRTQPSTLDKHLQSVYHPSQSQGLTFPFEFRQQETDSGTDRAALPLCGQMFERYAVPYKGDLACIDYAMRTLNLSIFGLELE